MSFSRQTQRHLDQAKTATASGDTDAAAGHILDAYVTASPEEKAQIKKGFNDAIRTWPGRG